MGCAAEKGPEPWESRTVNEPLILVSSLIGVLTRRCAESADNDRIELRGDYGCERVRNEASEMALVGIDRDPGPTDLKAARRGIGQALRTHYSDVLREEVPDRIADLLMQLDQHLRQLDQKDRDST